jgi:hypothetical protein
MRYKRAEKDSFPPAFIPEMMSFDVIHPTVLKISSKTVLLSFDLKLCPHQGLK